MTPPAPSFQRARRPEQKREREAAILDAARALALHDGVRSVSLADIAAEVGIHKSALLRYFETREEIFLRLGGEAWTEWAEGLERELGPRGEAAATSNDAVAPVTRLAEVLAQSLAERPLLCDVLAQAPLNLERNVSVEAARSFKLTALDAVLRIAAVAGEAVPGLGPTGGRELVAAVTSFAAAMWQYSNPSPTLAGLYAEDPRLAHSVVDFEPRVRRLTEAMIAGLQSGKAD